MGRTTDKKCILRIISRLNIGGPSIHAKILLEAFNNQDFETQLLIGRFSQSEGDMEYLVRDSDEQVHKISTLQREIAPLKDLLALWRIIQIICRVKPDIVHTHMAKAGAVGRGAAIICNLFLGHKIRLIHTFHGHVLKGYFGKVKSKLFCIIEKIFAIFTHRIVAISQTQKWELSKKYRIAGPEKIEIINLGFDLTIFANAATYKGQFRNRLGLDPETLLIGIVGRLVPIKNHYLFLEAAKRFIERNKNTPVVFGIIGDGELRSELETYAASLGISDKIYFHSWESNIATVYADLDILALTSLNEGTPVSIIESMAAKVPVVTTGVGGVKDLLGKFCVSQPMKSVFKVCERGVLCQKDNPDSFAQALEYTIKDHSVEKAQKLSNASSFVLKNYSDKTLVRRIRQLYDELTNKQ